MHKVFITRKIPEEGIELLKQTCEVEINPEDRILTRTELLEGVRNADAVLCLLTDKIDAGVFDEGTNCRGYANYAVGYDNIDVVEATRRKIPVSNTPGVLTDATAEMAWALIFAVSRRIVESDSFNRDGNWNGWGPLQFIGGDVGGKTLGIAGAGRIGTAMALKSRGFGMEVLYFDSTKNKVIETELFARKVDFETLLKESDFISIHLPLSDETKHLFGEQAIKNMKKTAYLINTARGPIIDEAALVKLLRNEEIAGAALDVYENEPELSPGLGALPNVILTPHTASATKSARTDMALLAARNVLAMLKGEKPPSCVNPEIYR